MMFKFASHPWFSHTVEPVSRIALDTNATYNTYT